MSKRNIINWQGNYPHYTPRERGIEMTEFIIKYLSIVALAIVYKSPDILEQLGIGHLDYLNTTKDNQNDD